MKRTINESQLKAIVAESVKRVLNEIGDTYDGMKKIGRTAGRAMMRNSKGDNTKRTLDTIFNAVNYYPSKNKIGNFDGEKWDGEEKDNSGDCGDDEITRDLKAKSYLTGEKKGYKKEGRRLRRLHENMGDAAEAELESALDGLYNMFFRGKTGRLFCMMTPGTSTADINTRLDDEFLPYRAVNIKSDNPRKVEIISKNRYMGENRRMR